MRLRIFERLKAEGIEIPFPQRDLNIKLSGQEETVAVLSEKMTGGKARSAEVPAVADVTVAKPAARKSTKRKPASKSGQDSMEDGSGPDGGDR